MAKIDALQLISIAERLIGIAGGATVLVSTVALQVAALKALAKQAGATDQELADLDAKLTAAIAAREAEQ